jgi:hypothetical protein
VVAIYIRFCQPVFSLLNCTFPSVFHWMNPFLLETLKLECPICIPVPAVPHSQSLHWALPCCLLWPITIFHPSGPVTSHSPPPLPTHSHWPHIGSGLLSWIHGSISVLLSHTSQWGPRSSEELFLEAFANQPSVGEPNSALETEDQC